MSGRDNTEQSEEELVKKCPLCGKRYPATAKRCPLEHCPNCGSTKLAGPPITSMVIGITISIALGITLIFFGLATGFIIEFVAGFIVILIGFIGSLLIGFIYKM